MWPPTGNHVFVQAGGHTTHVRQTDAAVDDEDAVAPLADAATTGYAGRPREVNRVCVRTHFWDVETTQFGFWRRPQTHHAVYHSEEDIAEAPDVDKACNHADHLGDELARVAEEQARYVPGTPFQLPP